MLPRCTALVLPAQDEVQRLSEVLATLQTELRSKGEAEQVRGSCRPAPAGLLGTWELRSGRLGAAPLWSGTLGANAAYLPAAALLCFFHEAMHVTYVALHLACMTTLHRQWPAAALTCPRCSVVCRALGPNWNSWQSSGRLTRRSGKHEQQAAGGLAVWLCC